MQVKSTLLTAKGVFSFNIGELSQQNSEFTKTMNWTFTDFQRQNVSLVELMQYLNHGGESMYDAAVLPMIFRVYQIQIL